jgi:type IV pilus assembly protein PilC
MTYKYTVTAADNKVLNGVIVAESEDEAEQALHQAGYSNVLALRKARPPLNLSQMLPSVLGPKPRDIIDLSLQLSDLIESGVDILTSLRLLENQAPKAAMRDIIHGLTLELQEGSVLSEALARYPDVFSDTYRQVIMASEQAGNLEVGLRQMAGFKQRRLDEKSKLTKALSYPVMVLLMAVGVLILLVTVVLPPLVGLFESFESELPWTTKAIISMTEFLTTYKFSILGVVVALALPAVLVFRRPEGKLLMDKIMLRLPVIGRIVVERNMAQFCRTASMLLSAGLPLPQMMDIAMNTLGNRVISGALAAVKDRSVQGQGLAGPMAENPLFPRLMVGRLQVGEKAGNLESAMSSLADFYEKQADRRIDAATSMIEPALTIGVGLMIGIMAVSVVTPIYSLTGGTG